MFIGIEVGLACDNDVNGIFDLLVRNQPDRGGTLSASFSREQIKVMITKTPVIVARRSGRVIGFLFSSPVTAHPDTPIVRAMLATYHGAPDAYIYGPICIEGSERGQGLAQAMFKALRARLPSQEGILFIRRDNTTFLRAHSKMGMRTVAEFTYEGRTFDIMSYAG